MTTQFTYSKWLDLVYFYKSVLVSVASLKSSSIGHDVHFINYDPIKSKIDNKAGYALGRGCDWQVATTATCKSGLFNVRLY